MLTAVGARVLFTTLVAWVAAQRLWELRRSAENERALRALGAVEHAPEQMPVMRALHAMWLVSMIVEVWVLHRVAPLSVFVVATAVFVVGQTLRWAAMHALGVRWSVRILTLPHAPRVTSGMFRWLRHPNYLGVALELAALPLMGGAWITAIGASVLNAALMAWRVPVEERALREAASAPRIAPALPSILSDGPRSEA